MYFENRKIKCSCSFRAACFMALTSPPPLTVLRMGIVNFMYCYSSAGNIKICLWKKFHLRNLWKIELFTGSSSQLSFKQKLACITALNFIFMGLMLWGITLIWALFPENMSHFHIVKIVFLFRSELVLPSSSLLSVGKNCVQWRLQRQHCLGIQWRQMQWFPYLSWELCILL